MAETNVPVTSGSGNNIDVFSLPNSNVRQAVVVGDSAIAGNVAPVQSTDPTSSTEGLVVRDVNTSAIVAALGTGIAVSGITNSIAVYVAATAGTINVQLKPGTISVQLDPGHTLGAISTINSINNTVFVQFDPGHTLGNVGSVGSITNTVAVFFSPANPTVNATFSTSGTLAVNPVTASGSQTMDDNYKAQRVLFVGSSSNSSLVISSITNTVAVFFSPSNPSVSATFSAASIEVIPTTGSRKITDDAAAAMRVLFAGSQTNASLTINGTVTANAGTGTLTVKFDPGYTLGKVEPGVGTFQVYLPDTGHEIGTVRGNTNTLTVFLPDTGHEIGSIRGINSSISVYLSATAGTLIIKPDPAGTFFVNAASTASIFTVSGSTSGVSVSGVNLIAPSSAYNFKIFAYSIQTTGIVSIVPKFVNGSGASQTEFWRPLVTSNQTSSAPIGANMAVQPPGFIFATGTNTSLNLLLDSGTLVHYSVSYIKETA